MATNGSISDPYSGRTQFDCVLRVTRHSTSGTKARWSWTLRAEGSGTSYCLNNWGWTVKVAGQTFTGSHNLDFRGGVTSILLGSGLTGWIEQGSGTKSIAMYLKHGPDACGIFGTAEKSGSFTADALVTVPGPPPAPQFTGATASALSFNIFQPANNGGSPVLDYTMAVYLPVSMGGSLVETWVSGATAQTSPSTLSPNITYRVQYRARNAVGLGSWSPLVDMTTLPATAPGMQVTPSFSGGSATVTLSAPGGAGGVTLYDVERRVQGSGTVVAATTPTNTYEALGLTPGVIYEWRARAHFGSYLSPWTSWLAVQQPSPSTSPGAFFDGNSPSNEDVDYSWVGTTNLSRSIATGVEPLGWGVQNWAGGNGIIQRVLGGQSQQYAARVMIIEDTTGDGVRAGQINAAPFRTDVLEGSTYTGSMYVQPSRSQRMAARLYYLDDTGAVLTSFTGTAEVVSPDGWTRLTATGQSPADAVYAVVQVLDVSGTGWSAWLSGESFLMDSAMISFNVVPYFDGATPDAGTYAYSWEGDPNESVSRRTTVPVEQDDPLLDPDCEPLPEPPRPPVILDDCIEDVVLWRRYWSTIPAEEVADWLEEVPSFDITTGSLPARQVRIRVYPNPFSLPASEIDTSAYCAEAIISYIPPETTLTLNGVSQRTFASVQGAEPIAADHLLYGPDGSPPTAWPILSCGVQYLVSFDVSADAPAGNITTGISLTRRH